MDRGNLCSPEYNDLVKLITYELFYEAIYNIFYDIISKKSLEIHHNPHFTMLNLQIIIICTINN